MHDLYPPCIPRTHPQHVLGQVLCGAVAVLSKSHEDGDTQLRALLWMLGTMGQVAWARVKAQRGPW